MSELKKLIIFNVILLACITLMGFAVVEALLPHARDRIQDITRLQDMVPILSKYQVMIYQKFSEYNTFYYARGQFCSRADLKCMYNLELGQPFDAQADYDFAAINSALSATGLEVESVDAKIGTAGDVRYAEFRVKCLKCGNDRYAYAVNEGYLPGEVPNNLWVTPIYGAWYLIQESWH